MTRDRTHRNYYRIISSLKSDLHFMCSLHFKEWKDTLLHCQATWTNLKNVDFGGHILMSKSNKINHTRLAICTQTCTTLDVDVGQRKRETERDMGRAAAGPAHGCMRGCVRLLQVWLLSSTGQLAQMRADSFGGQQAAGELISASSHIKTISLPGASAAMICD